MAMTRGTFGDQALVFTQDVNFAVQWHAVLRPLSEVVALRSFDAAKKWFAIAEAGNFKALRVVVLDLAMLRANELDADPEHDSAPNLLAWRSLSGRTPLILAGVEFSVRDELAALAAGVAACCDTRMNLAELARIAGIVIDGGVWVSAMTLPNLLARLQTVAKQDTVPLVVVDREQGAPTPNEENVRHALAELTDRQRAVARLVANGSNNKEIARALNITERTVKAHLTEVFERLKISDRLQLAVRLNRN